MTLEAADLSKGRVLRIRWELGLCKLDQLIAWSDSLVARLDDPPDTLIELSFAREGDFQPTQLDALLGEKKRADEIVLALARLNPDEWSLHSLCHVLDQVSGMAIDIERDPSALKDDALEALHCAFDAFDSLYLVELGKVSEAQFRLDLSEYFHGIRKIAAVSEAAS